METHIQEKKITLENWISWGMLVFLFAYMLTLNVLMPLHRDDYEYALIWGTYQHLTTWSDVFQSLYNHYMTHGGRMVDFFVLDSFLLLGKTWFNPFNAALYTFLMVLLYWYSQRKITNCFNPYYLAIIIALSWLSLPHFALTTIWMTGACVYLMPAVLLLTFGLPYYFQLAEKPLLSHSLATTAGMFILGFISTWTIENTAATMVLVVGISIFYFYKKNKLYTWMISGWIGSLLGFTLLVIAPGNYVRYAAQNSKLVYHFTNQLAGSGEMLLYAFPLLLLWRVFYRSLKLEYAKEKGRYYSQVDKSTSAFSAKSLFVLVMIVGWGWSYFTNGFLWRALANGMYQGIAISLGIASNKLQQQFFNTMSGLEEMILYLLLVGQVYRYVVNKLKLSGPDQRDVYKAISFRQIVSRFFPLRYSLLFFSLALLNNLAMLASPTFPGRATYTSVLLCLIGVMTLTTIPEVQALFLSPVRRKSVAVLTGVLFLPMAAVVLWQYILLDGDNQQRMAYIEAESKKGTTIVTVEPLTIKKRVLRHVYYIELDNSVSKYGLCRYYGLQDIRVKESPKEY